ncbi:PP2C family protein-serine/threonine phosphatase [Candidatus Korobacter versatilis]|nr:PP2C family protein-serine/threonine phosphatase [Candidatus Koribacter versatilis]
MLTDLPVTIDRATLRADAIDLACGTAFVIVGLASCAIAFARRRTKVRMFYWLGIWTCLYGVNVLWVPLHGIQPYPIRVIEPYARALTMYLVLPFAFLSWMEATRGWVRRFSAVLVVIEVAIAIVAFAVFLVTGDPNRLLVPNNLVAALGLAVLLVVVSSNKLFAKYCVMPSRGFFTFAAFVFTVEALFSNIINPLGHPMPNIFEHLGFAILLAAFGHSALQMVEQSERRLLGIESELQVAREIQVSILPTTVPELTGVRIAARYQPAASVAGDFYEFLQTDPQSVGILVADVCGHGVPAALIASMLKVAVQSVASSADHPGELLGALNRTLAAPLRGQLVSASYLWIDGKAQKARYSAAGHPPMLRWRNGRLEAVESNGLLFGVLPDVVYPEREIALTKGERLLIYTDGVTEPENLQGVEFGAGGLQALLAKNGMESGAEVATRVFAEVPLWQVEQRQQDDMTLVVVDVL